MGSNLINSNLYISSCRDEFQKGLCQAQMRTPQIEWLNGDRTIGFISTIDRTFFSA